jgi:2-isopropylmalate synthase
MIIYDTTLRDGAQSADVRFSVNDKLEILKGLDNLGVDYVELGWPAAGEQELEVYRRASKLELKTRIVAFGSTARKDTKPEDDNNLKAILASGAKYAQLFGKAWSVHVEKQLKATKEENLDLIRDSIAYLKSKDITVFFAAEHFFDGYHDDPGYALSCLRAAAEGGASALVLCDTNGGTLPVEFANICEEVRAFCASNHVLAELGVHVHNDSGCAVANSLLALEHGFTHLQGTINGFGERAGNADLCQILPALVLKKKMDLHINLANLKDLSQLVYTLANIRPNKGQPYVGRNAFRHKGGVHVDGLLKGASYEHINPTQVGNSREFILSELSGKSSVIDMLGKKGINADKNDPRVDSMLKEIKSMEERGYGIESLDPEKHLLIDRHFGSDEQFFKVKTWRVTSEDRAGEFSECVVSGQVGGEERQVVSMVKGGPVDALYTAMQKLIAKKYPSIKEVKLINYKVMIAEDMGASSTVRVFIKFQNSETWANVGVSTNILKASVEAIEKGFRYHLLSS